MISFHVKTTWIIQIELLRELQKTMKVEMIIAMLLSRNHVLLNGVPGLKALKKILTGQITLRVRQTDSRPVETKLLPSTSRHLLAVKVEGGKIN